MSIEIITAHEADQIIRLKQPLAWPPHNSCNGNCSQGRACDCLAAIDDEPPRAPMTGADALLAITLVLASWGAVMLVALAAGWIK